MRLIRSRIHYWSCSKFANWIRGENKPVALEWGEWGKWREKQKKERPFRYWLSDTLLNRLQNIIYFPYDLYETIRIYIRNRYIDKIHYLKTGLVPGRYYDFDYRIIHALFNELVDFVESELAASMKWGSNKKYEFKNGRCVEAAYDYFKSIEKNFDDARIKAATEPKTSSFRAGLMDDYETSMNDLNRSSKIKELYEWWKYVRPQRKNPYDNDNLGDIEDILDNKKFKEKEKLYEKVRILEQEYDYEDTKMLIELIKIRNHLWT